MANNTGYLSLLEMLVAWAAWERAQGLGCLEASPVGLLIINDLLSGMSSGYKVYAMKLGLMANEGFDF